MLSPIQLFRKQFPPEGPGIIVSPELRALSERPGLLGVEQGGQRMRNLYVDGSAAFEPSHLSDFGLACFIGLYDEVKQMINSGTAPDICGHETQYRYGYLTLVVCGRQRIQDSRVPMRHGDVVKYLLDHGAPTELEDIAGYTALQHATIWGAVADIIRILLVGGANPNHQNKYGCTALMDACLTGSVDSLELLLEFGADPDIPDADGCNPSTFCHQAGPQISAVFMKWQRKRSGARPRAREEKCCEACQKTPPSNSPLHICARCKTARYCNTTCQRAHWPTHKLNCHRFNASNTLTFIPYYVEGGIIIISHSTMVRKIMDLPDPSRVKTSSTGCHWPSKREFPKQLIVKIQVPLAGLGTPLSQPTAMEGCTDCLVYTKKRDLVCQLRRNENGAAYDALLRIIKSECAGGLKAYFAAEMKSKDELVIKVGEVLAEQSF